VIVIWFAPLTIGMMECWNIEMMGLGQSMDNILLEINLPVFHYSNISYTEAYV
jgi:hypothetical protein